MRKILPFFASGASFFLLAGRVFAQPTNNVDTCPKDGSFAPLCLLTIDKFGGIIGQAIGLIFVLAVVLALGYLIYGAVKWITSEGDKGHVETARNQIIAAIIGLVIIALSYLIMNLVLNFFLPGTNLTNLKIPTLGSVVTTPQPTCGQNVTPPGTNHCVAP